MSFYGSKNFSHNDYGCCPGHDRIFNAKWRTRRCETTRRLKRYVKKVERQRSKRHMHNLLQEPA